MPRDNLRMTEDWLAEFASYLIWYFKINLVGVFFVT